MCHTAMTLSSTIQQTFSIFFEGKYAAYKEGCTNRNGKRSFQIDVVFLVMALVC